MAGSSPFTVMTIVTEFSEFSETFRMNSIGLVSDIIFSPTEIRNTILQIFSLDHSNKVVGERSLIQIDKYL